MPAQHAENIAELEKGHLKTEVGSSTFLRKVWDFFSMKIRWEQDKIHKVRHGGKYFSTEHLVPGIMESTCLDEAKTLWKLDSSEEGLKQQRWLKVKVGREGETNIQRIDLAYVSPWNKSEILPSPHPTAPLPSPQNLM